MPLLNHSIAMLPYLQLRTRELLLAALAAEPRGVLLTELSRIVRVDLGEYYDKQLVRDALDKLESESLAESERRSTGAPMTYMLAPRKGAGARATVVPADSVPLPPRPKSTWVSVLEPIEGSK